MICNAFWEQIPCYMQVEVRSICSIYDANILAQSNSLRFRKKDLREVLEEKKKATHLAPSRADRVYQQQQPGRSRIGGVCLARSSSIEPLQKPVSPLDTWRKSECFAFQPQMRC